jgi:hypothetical protein
MSANLPTPGEWLREQVPDAWHTSADDRITVTDQVFLLAVEGYMRCLEPEQEARLSQDQLRRLTTIARRWTGQ